MKVLVEGLSLIPPRTGIGRYTESLIKGLSEHQDIQNVEIFLSVFPLGKASKDLLNKIKINKKTIQSHQIPLPYGTLLRSWHLMNWPKIDSFYPGFDIIHSPNYVVPPSKSAKKVVTIHDLSIFYQKDWYPKKSNQLIDRIKKSISIADLIIVPSQHAKNCLIDINMKCENKIKIIPYDIDQSFYPFSSDQKNVVKQSLFGNIFPYLLWVSEINPRKNIPMLFSLMDKLKQQGFDDLRLIMTGPKGYKAEEILSELEQYINLRFERGEALQKNRVWDILWLDYVNFVTLKQIYAAADLFIFPSWDEGFGFPVLEAMASGVPVICSNAGSLPEVVGEAAITAAPDDESDFLQAATKLLNDDSLYEHYRTMGLKHVQKFQKNQMIHQVVSAYQDLF